MNKRNEASIDFKTRMQKTRLTLYLPAPAFQTLDRDYQFAATFSRPAAGKNEEYMLRSNNYQNLMI